MMAGRIIVFCLEFSGLHCIRVVLNEICYLRHSSQFNPNKKQSQCKFNRFLWHFLLAYLTLFIQS